MEDLAASIMSLPNRRHSAPLYLFLDVPGFPVPEHHWRRLLHDEEDDDGGCFEFAAAPRACASDVSAYADELFRGGALLPLKLPPRLQHRAAAWSAASSAATSPTARLRKTRSWSPFLISRRHRGFDPFAAALEKVRRDDAAPALPRRARSLPPLGGATAAAAAALEKVRREDDAAPAPRRAKSLPLHGGGAGAAAARLSSPRTAGTAARALKPRALRPRRRGAPCRSGLLVCFGF